MAALNLPSQACRTCEVGPGLDVSYPSAFHLPVIHPALLSTSHLFNLSYNNVYDNTDRFIEHNNNNDKPESSCSSSRDSRSSVSPTSTRENVIVRNDGKRKKDQVKDEAYWERRRKNNDAAKRSRDQRRQKEDEMANRALLLEKENMKLRIELEQLRVETDQLRAILLAPASLSMNMGNTSTLLTPTVIAPTQIFSSLPQVPLSSHRNSVLVSNPTKT
ncbi:unnamed protein product [Caenorhabditis auriculariae]|uniref:BZIP domain-containing protein n=1 Tax=Caenorhabditis auriculariae TaxID=2777116 RepID=A0A8S1GTG1_9PELO|nr:unnamed protein product [Caenorhabditis auriculariae]